MQYFLFGLVALLILLLLTRQYTLASPHALARGLRVGAGVAALAGAAFLVFRGAVAYGLSLAALGSWLLWGGGGMTWGGFPGRAHKSPGQVSRVATDYLEVELEHDTGEISGRVLKGKFAGRQLESLTPFEAAQLWQECRFADPESASILEAYLDRVHENWREDLARAGGESAASRRAAMTREQALQVLGLDRDASEEDIRRAHRELMLKLHPDRGGSTYLAAQINQAKEVLLGKSG
jgi:hypothetical protein